MADESPRRRRRRREPGPEAGQAPPPPSPASLAALTSPVHDPEEEAGTPVDDRETERGLRGLVGGGSSQVRVTAALRARDAARPTAEDVAAAETNLTIIRRGWTPPPTNR
ncbi:MAG TPA: hypothetical protein VJT31_01355 [Rugosimonospora sp.]|nr:hypothetical protein [Rugosimonospora sp.]